MTTEPIPQDPEFRALLDRALELTEGAGQVPSQRFLKKTLKVGEPKAKAVREALLGASEWTAPGAPEVHPGLRLVATQERIQETADSDLQERTPGAPGVHPETAPESAPTGPPAASPDAPGKHISTWPIVLLILPAFVAIWSGWVGLGELAGFGVVHPLPGIADGFTLNTAITLPIGVETYAAYALRVWLSGNTPHSARRFARGSVFLALGVGALGQVAYHLMTAAGMHRAPWPITILVSCLPVAVLGMGAALRHLITSNQD